MARPVGLRTERDVIATLAGRAVTMTEIYQACEAAGVIDRAGGSAPIAGHGSDTVWRRRARNALQALKAAGRARRIGESTWVIDGSRDEPRRALLVLCSEPGEIELACAKAEEFFATRDEPFDLIIADPPYGLGVPQHHGADGDRCERVYARDSSKVLCGYREVEGDYGEFTHRWMSAAARTLRWGGQLVVITGTTNSWRVGHAAHDAGLQEVCQIAAQRRFALRHTRQPAYAHWVINVFCRGPKTSTRRVFHALPELPKAASGADYPLDVWAGDDAVPRYDRRGLLRYANALPPQLVDRLVRMFSDGPDSGGEPWCDLVGDPFVGSGTTPLVCLQRGRRFAGCDLNPQAVRFTMARLAAETGLVRLPQVQLTAAGT